MFTITDERMPGTHHAASKKIFADNQPVGYILFLGRWNWRFVAGTDPNGERSEITYVSRKDCLDELLKTTGYTAWQARPVSDNE